MSRRATPVEVDWERLDKTKFLFVGAGLFSGVTTCLFPLTVIKTRQMALPGAPSGLRGAQQTAQQIWRYDGIRGFYRGFGTVIFGAIPARGVYLTTLEAVKSAVNTAVSSPKRTEAQTAAISNFVGGAVASCVTQTVVVPIDVVSQRLMMLGGRRGTANAAATPASAAPATSHAAAAPSAAARSTAGSAAPSAASRSAGIASASTPGTAATQMAACAPDHATGSTGQTRSMSSSSSASIRQAALDRRLSSLSASSSGGGASSTAPSGAGAGARSMSSSVGHGAQYVRMSGLQMARQIIQREGVLGLYRGFGASLATFVPSSAVWWSAYGAYQKVIWSQVDKIMPEDDLPQLTGLDHTPAIHSASLVFGVQTCAGLLAGCTSAVLTNPLDVVKTRLQVAEHQPGTEKPSFSAIARQLLQTDGPRGFLKGVVPRMANVALWGTCMVSTYEFLKRLCVVPEVKSVVYVLREQ